MRICLWMLRASARQWKITSAKCVVTEQQGADVKIELIAVPAHLHQQRARLPPGVFLLPVPAPR